MGPIPGIHVGMDDENSHAEEYVKYMEETLKREEWERECARKNAKIIEEDFKRRLKELQNSEQ